MWGLGHHPNTALLHKHGAHSCSPEAALFTGMLQSSSVTCFCGTPSIPCFCGTQNSLVSYAAHAVAGEESGHMNWYSSMSSSKSTIIYKHCSILQNVVSFCWEFTYQARQRRFNSVYTSVWLTSLSFFPLSELDRGTNADETLPAAAARTCSVDPFVRGFGDLVLQCCAACSTMQEQELAAPCGTTKAQAMQVQASAGVGQEMYQGGFDSYPLVRWA